MLTYNPISSFINFMVLQLSNRIMDINQNIGSTLRIHGKYPHYVFKEICILKKDKTPKEGHVIFEIIFHSSKMPVDTIKKRTKYTLPFFTGLPGFCGKKFLVNEQEKTFSGRYEWETAELARKYARSYAVRFMARRSKPYAIHYKIYDKATGQIIESKRANSCQ